MILWIIRNQPARSDYHLTRLGPGAAYDSDMIYAGSATTNALLSNLIEPPAYIAMPGHTRHETFNGITRQAQRHQLIAPDTYGDFATRY